MDSKLISNSSSTPTKPQIQSSFQRKMKKEKFNVKVEKEEEVENKIKSDQLEIRTPSTYSSIPGTKLSIHNGQALISSGLFEFDEIMGGGIPLGTLLLIEEDEYSNYSNHFLKYFVAEGIAVDHEILFVSGEFDQPNTFLSTLPKNLTLEEEKEEEKKRIEQVISSATENKMSIAWQYEKYLEEQTKQQTSNSPLAPGITNVYISGRLKSSQIKHFCHSYDLGRASRLELLKGKSIQALNIQALMQENQTVENISSNFYQKLYSQLANKLKQNSSNKNVCRIAIQSLGSPMWFQSEKEQENHKLLLNFLHAIHCLIRSFCAVCMITIPSYIYPSLFRNKLYYLFDFVFAVHSFAGYLIFVIICFKKMI